MKENSDFSKKDNIFNYEVLYIILYPPGDIVYTIQIPDQGIKMLSIWTDKKNAENYIKENDLENESCYVQELRISDILTLSLFGQFDSWVFDICIPESIYENEAVYYLPEDDFYVFSSPN